MFVLITKHCANLMSKAVCMCVFVLLNDCQKFFRFFLLLSYSLLYASHTNFFFLIFIIKAAFYALFILLFFYSSSLSYFVVFFLTIITVTNLLSQCCCCLSLFTYSIKFLLWYQPFSFFFFLGMGTSFVFFRFPNSWLLLLFAWLYY